MPLSFDERMPPLSVLLGKTLSSCSDSDDELLSFVTVDGERYELYHDQNCCESVYIESIDGDLSDLVGSPLLQVDEIDEEREKLGDWDESFTWTFYRFATIKGSVTIRFYGTSNGYYSESVDFRRTA